MTTPDPKPNHSNDLPVDPAPTDPLGIPPQGSKPGIDDPNKLGYDPSSAPIQQEAKSDKKKKVNPKDPEKMPPYIDKPDVPYIDGPDVPTDKDTIY